MDPLWGGLAASSFPARARQHPLDAAETEGVIDVMALLQPTQVAEHRAIRLKIHVSRPVQHVVLHRRMVVIRIDVLKPGRRQRIDGDQVAQHVRATGDP